MTEAQAELIVERRLCENHCLQTIATALESLRKQIATLKGSPADSVEWVIEQLQEAGE